MFRILSPAALAVVLFVSVSCERHHVGELPELQREHLHPLTPEAAETKAIGPTPPGASVTPANFFPSATP